MPKTIQVTTLEAPELQHYRIRKNTVELQRDGLFLAEGKHVVARLLTSGLETISVLTTESVLRWLEENVPSSALQSMTVFLASREFMSTLVGYDVQQPILALGKTPADTLPENAANRKHSCIVAVDHLTNPDNLGGIVRNSAAFGVDLFIAGESSASPYYRRAVRNSMGTVFRQPVFHSNNLRQTLSELRTQWNFDIIGTHTSGSVSLQDIKFGPRICLVFGNEELGLCPEILEICTKTASIPLAPSIDSFNVSNAAAIFLWEQYKQRHENRVL
jgi:tRNA G18 (ribose-2'-O)-methylase SpoU